MDKCGKNSKVCTTEWAIKRYLEGQGRLPHYQVRNIMITITLDSKSNRKHNTSKRTKKKENASTKVLAEDLAELQRITKQASGILNKYD